MSEGTNVLEKPAAAPAATATPPAKETPAPAAKAAPAATGTEPTGKDAKPAPQGSDRPAGAKDGAAVDDKAVAKPATSVLDDLDDDDDGDALAAEGAAELTDGTPKAGDFPDNWRETLAKGNEKVLKRLQRYKSLSDAMAAGLAAQDKIRSGDYKAQLPEDATDEQKAEWRKDHGIPAEAKAYETALTNHKWTEEDAPVLDRFKSAAFEADLSQTQVTKVLDLYANLIEDAKDQREEATLAKDREDREATLDALRSEMGGEFKGTLRIVDRILKDSEVFPEGTADRIAQARYADGTRILNDKAFVGFLASLARERYGDTALISGDAKRAEASVEEQARTIMKTDFARYVSEGWDKKLADIERKRQARA